MQVTSKSTRSVNATGRDLRQLLHGKPSSLRAMAAAGLVTGELQLVRPLPAQAARLCQVDPSRVHEALSSDRYVDELVERVGANRVMAALDRVTAPQRLAAE